ncbi:MAG TPA: 1-deoxy-D-xylulose-5-phosphate synthase [Gammaproteobacteria bacterium]|jgi:1-deoxy-D-xylulose-5-phosphate synthase|nr:1-deoxy-D-xylulose-5-phosphate synthase [Gammaproteobacteria bacterium]
MTTATEFPLLSGIDSPADLRALPETDLKQVADELRAYLIKTVSGVGGHFAAGLGVVELTLALHYVFDTPNDRLVWDVGHQAYPHKVLTGRRDQLGTIRKRDGLAPFPRRAESEYDTFGVGHSSTSISAALGMALAAQQKGEDDRHVVALIGDGAMTAGMAFEALNHAGSLNANLLVVLNDNDMSISGNVGALSNYFAKVLSGQVYAHLREGGKKALSIMPPVKEWARRSEEHVKGMVMPGTLFEELGFNYIGPVDGHNLHTLVKTLQNMRALKGPQFLHVVTRKGKGYEPAEKDPIKWHGPAAFDAATGIIKEKAAGSPNYSEVFGKWLCDMAAKEPKLVAITPAMREGSGMVEYAEKFPSRYFDVGIAEQHAVTLAAGFAVEGLKPVVAIYSTFLQRGYDQLVHDVALQNLPVLFAIDRAGLVGPDGPTHAGSYDFAFMRCLPNLVLMAPADENECRQMLYTGMTLDQPSAVRYPRGRGPGVSIQNEMRALPVGKAEVRRRGKRLALLGFGAMVEAARATADALDATLVNMRFVKPLDEELLLELATTHTHFVTLEDHAVAGGAGSAVNECLEAHGVLLPVLNLGLPDMFLEHGSREECLKMASLDADGIRKSVDAWLADKSAQTRRKAGT